MRQLSIALALFVVFIIGCYYMFTQRLDLEKYYPPGYQKFPQNIQAPPLRSPDPGPTIAHFAAPRSNPKRASRVNVRTGLKPLLHIPNYAPPPMYPQAVTPIPVPVPTYAPVTPPPAVHTIPPFNPFPGPTPT